MRIQVLWNTTPSRLVFTDVTYCRHYASPKRRLLSTQRSLIEELTFRHHGLEDIKSHIFSELSMQRTHEAYVREFGCVPLEENIARLFHMCFLW